MIDAGSLAAVGAAFFVVAASPGPGNLASASVSLAHGRAVGFRFAAGLASGLCFWGLMAALGMGAILQTSLVALTVLKVAGGLYLLWLAWSSGRAALRRDLPPVRPRADGRWYLRGLVFNILNPKAVLAWMAAFSVGLGPEDGWAAVLAATLLCVGLTIVNATLWAWIFSIPRLMLGYTRIRRGVDAAMAGVFAAAGFGLLRSAAAR